MDSSIVLQALNTVVLALVGVAGWRMMDEWRKSREERHNVEIEVHKLGAARLKDENERLRDDKERLKEEKERLKGARDERVDLLEREIRLYKAQSPSQVSAEFDALNKRYEAKLGELQSALAARDVRIRELEAAAAERPAAPYDMTLRTILAAPTGQQRLRLETDRARMHSLAVNGLILALGHWDAGVREMARKSLVARGADVVYQLVAVLRNDRLLEAFALFFGRRVQRAVGVLRVLTDIGDPAIPQLEKALSGYRITPRIRAVEVLRRIGTKEANAVLQRHERVVRALP